MRDTGAADEFHLNVGRTIGALEILVSMAESYCNADELRAAILDAKPIVDYWTKPQAAFDIFDRPGKL